MTTTLEAGRRHPPGTAAAAMVTDVKLSPADVTVGELRSFFTDGHVHAALLIDDGVLVAVVDRADLDARVPDDAPAVDAGRLSTRVVGPECTLDRARWLLRVSGRRRLAVVADGGTLLGLLCLKQDLIGFCSDRDVRDRTCGGRAG